MISIIMPAYNSEHYIGRAIESILKQSYGDFELIIVNDGSKDSTLEIIKRYQRHDKRIIAFSKDNGGICSARNYGLSKAKGEFVTFCDNDDTYEIDLLKDNYERAVYYNADLVRWNFTTIVDGIENKTRVLNDNYILGKEKIAQNYIELRQTNDAVWNGLFKKTFLDKYNIVFNEFMRYGGEDLYFSLNVIYCLPSIVINSKSYYNWYVRNNHSTTTKRNINFCDSMLINADFEYKLINNLNALNLWSEIGKEYYNYILKYAGDISIWKRFYYRKILKGKEWSRDLL